MECWHIKVFFYLMFDVFMVWHNFNKNILAFFLVAAIWQIWKIVKSFPVHRCVKGEQSIFQTRHLSIFFDDKAAFYFTGGSNITYVNVMDGIWIYLKNFFYLKWIFGYSESHIMWSLAMLQFSLLNDVINMIKS